MCGDKNSNTYIATKEEAERLGALESQRRNQMAQEMSGDDVFFAELRIKQVKNYWLISLENIDKDFISKTYNGVINQLTKYLKESFNGQPEPEEKKEEMEKGL